ncbi:glycosyltransferase [Zunongwangia sp. H14]|uniref:glycosyltransferase n=1 Tax=Zunongwangia sp. H14 TaxID=3240792 RepID=UPI003561346B
MEKIKEPNKKEGWIIKFMILLGITSIVSFILYFFQPQYVGNIYLYILLAITMIYSAFKKLYIWYNYSNISIPEEKAITANFKVDILTTYFPGEPYQMIITTLEAILKISYPHETYLCDEANDPFLKKFCEEHGIHHVTRNNRINAKAGNINNALHTVANGDICVILDPDHIPDHNFLDPVLPHFENRKIGFVQIVQSYYNIRESLVAKGAAEQTFQFYGPVMMTLNSYQTVNAIGANCVFRREALDSIGGHAPGLCEDMHTAMLMYSKGWKSVYVPKVLAKGLAPSNLTNFFKQQLKWSRGSFDLLRKVYPQIFGDLTPRQKIHFGLLPLHYLGGIICLINFLIPIFSLVFSITPWKGDILDFAIVLLPVVASSLLIRVYIQKWVIEKKERGFHLVGGLLYINTWWIYIIGLVYTLLDKKVPYLPTPKEDEWNTNFKIVIPNAVIAVVSFGSIIYGLQKDLTPFSIIMAGFALFNSCIMLFGIYLTIRIQSLRNKKFTAFNTISEVINNLKEKTYVVANSIFFLTRKIAFPLLLMILLLAMSTKYHKDSRKWTNVKVTYIDKSGNNYLGIFQPTSFSGISNLDTIKRIEKESNINFDIISFYLAWGDKSENQLPEALMDSIYSIKAIPMLTWEPWSSEFSITQNNSYLKQNHKIFKNISEGQFDDYIKDFGKKLAAYQQPVFLRFAHEFDNPQYPWSSKGNNTPEEFIAAWRHVYNLLQSVNAQQVMMVWNPWRPQFLQKYYPGDRYVDWIGITALDYGKLNHDKNGYSFDELYKPFHYRIKKLTNKPVMLAEFGSLKLNENQEKWTVQAMETINQKYPEISAVVLFNSAYDTNIPKNNWYTKKELDWTTSSFSTINQKFKHRHPLEDKSTRLKTSYAVRNSDQKHPLILYDIKGVRYKKGYNWKDNYYAATRKTLQHDFQILKDAGFNTLQFRGGNIYDHNLLSYAFDFQLQVIYEFDVNNSLNFIDDKNELSNLKEKILDKVRELKEENSIIGYTFRDDLNTYFEKPLLFYQRKAYLEWLISLAKEIKQIDPGRSLNLDLVWSNTDIPQMENLYLNSPFDSFGIQIYDAESLENFQNYTKQSEVPLYISAISPELLLENPEVQTDFDVVLQNYQNERRSSYVTLDGLIDFDGKRKDILKKLEDHWKSNKEASITEQARILRPSEPLFSERTSVYHPLLYRNGQWVDAPSSSQKYEFVWYLIKNDRYGNPIAVKKVGNDATLRLEIPENYKEYELLLTVYNKKENYSFNSRSQLHTPAGETAMLP